MIGRKSKPVILLAPQRSGTTVFQKTVAKSVGVQTFGEVFHSSNGDNITNFFNYIKGNEAARQKYLYPSVENVEALFVSYFSYLRGLADGRYHIVDIKQNSLHHLNAVWHEPLEEPLLLRFIKEKKYDIIRIVRKNLFAQVLSTYVANRVGMYHVVKGDAIPEVEAGYVDPQVVLRRMESIDKNNAFIDECLDGYSFCHFINYEDMFNNDVLSDELLNIVNKVFSGIQIHRSLVLKKINKNAAKFVLNVAELKNFFSGTKYGLMVTDVFGCCEAPKVVQSSLCGIECVYRVKDFNRWCSLSDPGTGVMRLHPNEVGDPGPCVEIADIQKRDISRMSFNVVSSNESPKNPGAHFSAIVFDGGKRIREIDIDIKPHVCEKINIDFDTMLKIPVVRICVTNLDGSLSNQCSAVDVKDFKLL